MWRSALPEPIADGRWSCGSRCCETRVQSDDVTLPRATATRKKRGNGRTCLASISLHDLRKSFGGTIAVRDISAEFDDGKLTSVLGPSGCGKTTTLNM